MQYTIQARRRANMEKERKEKKGRDGSEWNTGRKRVNHGKEECQMFCEHL